MCSARLIRRSEHIADCFARSWAFPKGNMPPLALSLHPRPTIASDCDCLAYLASLTVQGNHSHLLPCAPLGGSLTYMPATTHHHGTGCYISCSIQIHGGATLLTGKLGRRGAMKSPRCSLACRLSRPLATQSAMCSERLIRCSEHIADCFARSWHSLKGICPFEHCRFVCRYTPAPPSQATVVALQTSLRSPCKAITVTCSRAPPSGAP